MLIGRNNIKLGQIVIARSRPEIKIKMSDGTIRENVTVAGIAVKLYIRGFNRNAMYVVSLNNKGTYRNWLRYGEGFYVDEGHFEILNVFEPIIDNYIETKSQIIIEKETNYSTSRNNIIKGQSETHQSLDDSNRNTTMFITIPSGTIKMINSIMHPNSDIDSYDYIYVLLNGQYGKLFNTYTRNIHYCSEQYFNNCRKYLALTKSKAYELISKDSNSDFFKMDSSVCQMMDRFDHKGYYDTSYCNDDYLKFTEFNPDEDDNYDEIDYEYWDALIGDDKQC